VWGKAVTLQAGITSSRLALVSISRLQVVKLFEHIPLANRILGQ
jgi:hypothetical protein